ncbi:hypothetical protein M885DRAFT_610552 [Pelagophyceae sp. CCMP2097]|nr:hypothetical protein M885DRAFT_610552 [Pelagophyceae sp. CCMP2097]|mmetsp:Transcript_8733/g.28713  ORF Transcript_8733/g.28713 Transcript_8733/m.28713 type:complete len:96 (+) Transcript_8733:65-352(+)|eukprot:CAMPEP_0206814442 /NCGR_PEP_ID=MMETSP0975-20121206/8782_1 /ASSEMBLY_ACC=CAM_ASM_000399 /TAXON_ID=483370 /ORGANISM="non described non described, Strain CCMP2097" /LENGTH=95 /DNA_ID=CAMNT_0054356609 /DNA_START=45 /DNA_END=332 /DNA_ORIENTATION=-
MSAAELVAALTERIAALEQEERYATPPAAAPAAGGELVDALRKENEELQKKLRKAEYRVQHLVRTVDDMDKASMAKALAARELAAAAKANETLYY